MSEANISAPALVAFRIAMPHLIERMGGRAKLSGNGWCVHGFF